MYESAIAQSERPANSIAYGGTRHVQRLFALDAIEPRDIAMAIATDALEMFVRASHVAISLRMPGAPRVEWEAARHDLQERGEAPTLQVPVRAAHGRAGTISLWLGDNQHPEPGDEFAALALSWLTAAVIDRVALGHAEQRWQREKRRLDATFFAAPVGIAHVAPDGTFLAVNERFASICGHRTSDLLLSGFQRITHPDDLATDMKNVRRLLSGETDRYMMEKRYVRPDGSHVWVNLTVAIIRDPAGEPDFFVSVIEDLSEMKQAQAEATRDPLTGTLNRRGLLNVLDTMLQHGKIVTLIYIDLNGFKRINDRFGHARGDACLVEAARTFCDVAGTQAHVGRLGGDEFVIAIPDPAPDADADMVRTLRDALAGIEIAPGWTMSASYGSASSRRSEATTSAWLIEAADEAMFRDKRRARRQHDSSLLP